MEENGYNVIRPFDVKKWYFKHIKDYYTAVKYQMFSPYSNNPDKELLRIYSEFERIVLKDTRGTRSTGIASSFETLNGYLDYRSGCFYNWFDRITKEPKI